MDAFTHEAFGGNSAAVVLLDKANLPLADSVRLAIAAEMNLSETAFLEIAEDSLEGAEGKVASNNKSC